MIRAILILMLYCPAAIGQVLIHAHNDYEKPQPLVNALKYKTWSVEADVWLRGNELVVAHTANEIDTGKTLEKMYLKPMQSLFQKNKGHISEDTSYRVALVIDIKENAEAVFARLIQILQPYLVNFDLSKNPHGVQIIISGDRGAIAGWCNRPAYIFFDGRPYEQYDAVTLSRIALISDSYLKYIDNNMPGNTDKLKTMIDQSHKLGKPVRLWGAPDTEQMWVKLLQLGADIINTDKIEACRKFFKY
jgi:hypothetical protein